jgi:hypothetical protein
MLGFRAFSGKVDAGFPSENATTYEELERAHQKIMLYRGASGDPMPRQKPSTPEVPRVEPEIIPPERSRNHPYRSEWFFDQRSPNRVFVARVGPWSIIGIVLLFGLIVGATLAILLGTLLIALPIIGLLIAAAMISNALRGHWQRPR